MGQYYFIPTSSINYNNILASESISPPAFYTKRGYGFKRFEKVTPSPLNHSFLAYSKIPKFSLKNSEREEFPLFIAVPKDFLSSFNVIDKGHFEIVQIDGTIFLNPKMCFFLVNSEQEKMKLIASTQRSVEVKSSNEYNNVVYSLVDLDLNSFLWDDSCLNELLDFKNINENSLKKDQKINKLKGFLYGFGAGKMMDQSDDLINGRRYFQDFVNVFSNLMNELSYLSSNKSKVIPVSKNLNTTFEKLTDLKYCIGEAFGQNDEKEIKAAIIRDFGIGEEFIKLLDSASYKKTKTTLFSIISDFIKSKETHYYTVEDLLGQLIQRANNLLAFGSSEGYRKLERDFDKVLSLVKAKISSFQSDEISKNKLESLPFKVTSELGIEIQEGAFPKEELDFFEVISNEFLERIELSSSDEIGQLRKDFIESIGKRIREISNQKDSEELVYLRDLYLSLKTVGVGFKPFHIENKALQSLACFMTRYAELGKLQDYMEKNGLKDFKYAYSYWGAAYGYANLSKLFIEPIAGNPEIIKLINSFLTPLIGQGEYEEGNVISYISGLNKPTTLPVSMPEKIVTKYSTPQIPKIESDTKNQAELKKEVSGKEDKQTFGEILKLKSSFGNNNEWISIIVELGRKAEEDAQNGKGYFQNQSNPLREFAVLINNARDNMHRFGLKKQEEAVNLFAEYLTNK